MLACLVRFGVRCRYRVQIRDYPSLDQAALFMVDRRAAGRCGVYSLSAVSLSGSEGRGQQPRVPAIAATLVPPLDSPILRGVKGKPPLVAFLSRAGNLSFRERKEKFPVFRSLYCSSIENFKSSRPESRHAALQPLAIHKVFPAVCALPGTILSR